MSGIMFNASNPNLKSLASIIEEQLSNISLGGSLHNIDADPNIVSVLEDRHNSDSESSASLAEARRNSGCKDDTSPAQDADKIVENLSCDEVRWFYKEPGNTKWTPFGGFDTLTIEAAYRKLPVDQRGPKKSSPKSETPSPSKEEDPKEEMDLKNLPPKVLVLGGLYELEFVSRTCSSIYWPGEMFRTTRGTWFYESWQPLDEEAADIIEQDHLNVFVGKKASDFTPDTKPLHYQSVTDFNVDWYSPNEVYVYSRGTPSKLVRSFTKKLGYFQKSAGTRVIRGYKTLATDADKHKDISHLVFVVHGIGQKMNIGAQIFRNTCVIRERVATLKEKYFPESNQRAEFFPVEWRSNLVLDNGTVDAITPPHIKYLRNVLNTSAMDIMYYTSPIYCGEIQEGVADEMNRLYSMFCERNPHIKPRVSVIAHSLGAVIVYDIVNGYIPQVKRLFHVIQKLTDFLPAQGFVCDGSFQPGKSRLNFELDNFFCLGSPLSVFLALRSKKGEHGYHLFPPSLCKRLYNVYHLTDPVAYRLEPLVLKEYCKIAPLPIHPCNAAKPVPYSEMPLELEETEGFLSTTIGAVSGNAATSPPANFGESSSTTSPDTPCKDKGWSIWNTIWKNQKNSESGSSPHTMDSPSQGLEHRLDYVLTSGAAGPFVVRSVLVSHTAYWSNNDVAFFVLTRIFPELEEELCSEERYGTRKRKKRHSKGIRKLYCHKSRSKRNLSEGESINEGGVPVKVVGRGKGSSTPRTVLSVNALAKQKGASQGFGRPKI